jgi:hypothetical protein
VRYRGVNPKDRVIRDAGAAKAQWRVSHGEEGKPIRNDASLLRQDPIGNAMPAHRQQAERPLQTPRGARRGSLGQAERPLEARELYQGSQGPAQSRAGVVATSAGPSRPQGLTAASTAEDRLCEAPSEPMVRFTEVERAAIQAEHDRVREHWDCVYAKLRVDAQTSARAMEHSPLLADPFDDVVAKSPDDYRSGRSLMDQLGANRLLDPATTGMLLAIRRGLIEETGAATTSEMMLIDMAVTAFANAMRIQSMVGNTSLFIEAELFGQPSLRAQWKKARGGRPEDIHGLAVDEHVALLRDRLMPLIERFHRQARDGIEAIGRTRQTPAAQVERARPIELVLA